MAVYPYEYRKARFQISNYRGYWVRLWLLFITGRVHVFYNRSDAIENGSLINESDSTLCTLFSYELLVTKDKHSDIFNEIVHFEDNVLVSDFD